MLGGVFGEDIDSEVTSGVLILPYGKSYVLTGCK